MPRTRLLFRLPDNHQSARPHELLLLKDPDVLMSCESPGIRPVAPFIKFSRIELSTMGSVLAIEGRGLCYGYAKS